ncbi:MAG: ABC transporter permease [Sphingomonadales bacterium]|nr:ABC transporter permease [Sphingomonadales bacterium]
MAGNVGQSFYIAWRYLAFHKWRTAILVLSLSLIVALPLAVDRTIDRISWTLKSRAKDTPLLLGPRESSLDLVLSALYFIKSSPAGLTYAAVDAVERTQLARAIPLRLGVEARGYPVVGTDLDYIDFRQLKLAQGRLPALLGDCVLGATAARQLRLAAGDTITTNSKDFLNIAGAYPMRLNIVGVLASSHTPDDDGIFVDLKTMWVAEGIGHGHQDLTQDASQSLILKQSGRSIAANAAVMEYQEVTPDNLSSYHFHGDQGSYPLTAVIVAPTDQRAATILRGRFMESDASYRLLLPSDAIDKLLNTVFRLNRLFQSAILVTGLATVGIAILVFVLSAEMRRSEMATLHMMGSRRTIAFELYGAEALIILGLCLVAAFTLAAGFEKILPWIFYRLLEG